MEKDFFASKANWGTILMSIGVVLSYFGVEFDVELWAADLARLSEVVMVLIGVVLSIWGRITATAKITKIAGVSIGRGGGS